MCISVNGLVFEGCYINTLALPHSLFLQRRTSLNSHDNELQLGSVGGDQGPHVLRLAWISY